MRFSRQRRNPSTSERPTPRFRSEAQGDVAAEAVLGRIRATDWGRLTHAYGDASGVERELGMVTLGDGPTRRAAWNELWGTVLHQGTVYEATIPAVEVVADLAGWSAFPDRREALCMLGAFAEGDGSHAAHVAAAVGTRAIALVDRWRDEPELIQRALLMLARSAGVDHVDLVESVLPRRLSSAWDLGTSADIWARFGDGERVLDDDETPSFDAAMDALSELENWAFAAE